MTMTTNANQDDDGGPNAVSSQTTNAIYTVDPFLKRLPSNEFQCREITNKMTGSLSFQCTVKGNTKGRTVQAFLTFVCREPSYGVLTEEEEETMDTESTQKTSDDITDTRNDYRSSAKGQADDDNQEEDEFDVSGFSLLAGGNYPYAIAGKTGFQVWPGTRLLVDCLTFPRSTDVSRLPHWQRKINNHTTQCTGACKVLELGAGVGVVGLSLAWAGSQVLMTDLPGVVENSLIPNMHANVQPKIAPAKASPPPSWLGSGNTAIQLGYGWATAMSLDWTQPLDTQLTKQQYETVDVIIASDCVWLVSMLQGLLATVETIFAINPSATLLLSFQRRDADMFTTVDQVLEEIQSKGWACNCLAWYPVVYNDAEDGQVNEKEVFLFEVSIQNPY